ncbi:transmembrane protein 135-like isoform X2 [Lycorma delicatula]|uniref:transmembrane protein 135-like isoform X2 n=1 Tax=Lycorma delicatula TaxID=130591 RepID=UPI003F513697
MSVLSKQGVDQLHYTTACHSFHPWSPSCSKAIWMMWWDCFNSGGKIFGLAYLLQYMIKSKKEFYFLLRCFVGTLLHCAFSGSLFVASNCFFRRTFKRFNYYWIGFGNGVVLEACIRQLETKGFTFMSKSSNVQLLLFMLTNSILMYKLRVDKSNQVSSLWFFIPPQGKNKSDVENNSTVMCYHKDSCWKDIAKNVSIFFGLGAAVQCAKLILFSNKIRAPEWNDIILPTFTAGYVALYKVVLCTLYRLRGFDSAIHALPAGLISGSVLWFFPNSSLLPAALGNLIQILAKDFKNAFQLPDLPYKEFVFIICNGVLYFHRVTNPDVCPNFFIYIINSSTNNKAQIIYSAFKKRTDELLQMLKHS